MKLLAVALTIVLTGCATELGNSRAAQHGADQIRMIAVQREARVQEAQAQAQMNAALVEALARVAEANPEQASSVSVALAVIGVRGASAESEDAPTVTLQREQNVGLEYVKALAPTVGNLVSGLGVAAINANVQKNASDNNRDVMLGINNRMRKSSRQWLAWVQVRWQILVCRWAVTITTWKVRRILITALLRQRVKMLRLQLKCLLTRQSTIRVKR